MKNKALVVIDLQNDIKKKLPEMMGYYVSKGCTVDKLSEVISCMPITGIL